MKIKEIKIVNQDESTKIADIGADAINVDYNNTTVKAELDKLDTDNNTNKSNITNLQSRVSSLASGGPAGVYATVAALTSADPDHNKIYVVTADGHWYYYNNGWQDGGVYQSSSDTDTLFMHDNNLDQINQDLYEDWYRISPITIVNGRKLINLGYNVVDSDFKLVKYSIPDSVKIIYVNKDNVNNIEYYQFQNREGTIDYNGQTKKSIDVVGAAGLIGNQIWVVPEGATFLIITVPSEETVANTLVMAERVKKTENLPSYVHHNVNNELQIRNKYFELDSCPEYPIWEPDSTTSDYSCPIGNTSATCSLNYLQFLATFFDIYLGTGSLPNYSVTKRILGRDSSKKYDIWEYDFKPINYTKTLLLSAGMNANELPGEFGIAYFIKNVLTSDDPGLTYIRKNVRIKIIPCLCPYSFDASPMLYDNYNNISLNQNFDYNGCWSDISGAGADRKGAYALDQAETQIMVAWLNENANIADGWIDCHTSAYGIDSENNANLHYCVSSNSSLNNLIIAEQTKITNKYIEDGYITSDTPRINASCGVAPATRYPKHLYSYYNCNIPSIMIEQYTGNYKYGGTRELNNTDADIKNYVTMIRAYALAILRKNFTQYIPKDKDFLMFLYQLYFNHYGKTIINDILQYESGAFNNSGAPQPSTARIRSLPIPVSENDEFTVWTPDDYRVYEVFEYNSNGEVLQKIHNKSAQRQLSLTCTREASYIRFSVRDNVNTSRNIDPGEEWVSRIVVSKNNYALNGNTQFRYVTTSGTGLETTMLNRITYNSYIPVESTSTVQIYGFFENDLTLVDILFFDQDHNFATTSANTYTKTEKENYLEINFTSSFSPNYKYIQFSAKNNSNSGIHYENFSDLIYVNVK